MTKAMLIADQGIIGAGLTAPVEEALQEEGIRYVIYDKIVPNPRDFHCLEGAEFGREHEIDGMIAIGGGSSIDTAKAIGTLMTNGRDIRTWAGLNLLEREIPPLIAIPTTAGTGSEVTFDAVITDTKTHEKLNILDLKIAPKVALVDPQTLLKLPSRTMAACGIDALVHAVEAYTCKAACPHTDAYALYAIDIIQKTFAALQHLLTWKTVRAWRWAVPWQASLLAILMLRQSTVSPKPLGADMTRPTVWQMPSCCR